MDNERCGRCGMIEGDCLCMYTMSDEGLRKADKLVAGDSPESIGLNSIDAMMLLMFLGKVLEAKGEQVLATLNKYRSAAEAEDVLQAYQRSTQ